MPNPKVPKPSKTSPLLNLTTPCQQSLTSESNPIKNIPQYCESTSSVFHSSSDSVMEEDGNQNQKMCEIVSNLILKNKINTRNAFQVPLMDVSGLGYFGAGDEGAWRKISSTLENSSKVYGFRVDSVTQSINKMTSTIGRTVNTTSTPASLQAQAELQKAKKPKNCYQQQQNLEISVHLDQAKCNQDQLINLNARKSMQNCRLRRLLDQNGVSALILGNVPIAENLCINIENDGWAVQKKQTRKAEGSIREYPLPWGTLKSGNGIEITREIEQMVCRINYGEGFGIFQQIQYTCPNGFTNFLEEIEQRSQSIQNFDDELKDDIQSLTQISSNLECIQRANVPQCQNKNLLKAKKCQTKKIKQAKKCKKSKAPQIEIDFEPAKILQRMRILKPDQKPNNSRRNNRPKLNKNLISDQIFYLQSSQDQDHIKFIQHSQTPPAKISQLAQKTPLNHQPTNPEFSIDNHLHSFSFQALEQEQAIKYLQIRQNKEQIRQLLDSVSDKIEFSKLYKLHKETTQFSSEALDFLSVLHLCNQFGLSLTEVNSYDFVIRK